MWSKLPFRRDSSPPDRDPPEELGPGRDDSSGIEIRQPLLADLEGRSFDFGG